MIHGRPPALRPSVRWHTGQTKSHLCRPGWTFLSRGSFRLMLGKCADTAPAHETADHSYFAYVTVEGIDQFYTEVLGNGASLMQGLADKPWGMREFGVRTPDGYRIMFGQEL